MILKTEVGYDFLRALCMSSADDFKFHMIFRVIIFL